MVEVSHSLPQVTMLGLANADLHLVPTVNCYKSLYVQYILITIEKKISA